MGNNNAHEQERRSEVEALAKHLEAKEGKKELDRKSIKEKILAAFTKKLDGKLKNLQEGEGVAVTFNVDIIGLNGQVRGGSGAERNMPEYIEWRAAVYKRDGYKCQDCGSGKDIQAHHIQSWQSCPELRFEVSNGVTLCKKHHADRHPHLKLLG